MIISDIKPYPTYKDSGVEWLGEIPAHWEVTRADSLFRYEKIQIEPSTISEQSVFHYSIPAIQETGNGIFESPTGIDSAKLRVFGRRILVSKLNPRKGVVLIADEKPVPTICSTEFVPLEIRSCDLGWAYHLLASEPTRQRLSAVVRSATRSHQRAETAEVLKMWHGVPPILEQRAIAAFLDRETAKIDALVAKKERLIELLQEKRTALISHAVTKGLDPDVPLKDSGVEWLGEIPAQWEVKKLKRLAFMQAGTAITGDDIGTEGNYPVFGGNGVRGYTSSFTHEGEFPLIGRQGALCGCVNFATGKFWASEHAVVLRSNAGVNPSWLAQLLEVMSLNQYSQSAAQPGLSVETIGSIAVPVALKDEQRAIAAFLDRETAKIDALVAKVQEAIDRLKELRTALISAAVTGKIDVREAAE